VPRLLLLSLTEAGLDGSGTAAHVGEPTVSATVTLKLVLL
jgi:hypothetical protein